MINQIIKDWVGEERTEKTVHTPNCTRGTCKNNHFFCAISAEDEAVNEYIQDLTSRIPQLTERIVEEIEKLLIQQEAKLDNCNNVDGRVQDECFKRNRRAKDWNEIIRRIINTLKGGKENKNNG